MTEDEIKYILFNSYKILKDNENRAIKLYETLDDVNEIIRSVSLSSPSVGSISGKKGTANDLTSTFLKYEESLKSSNIEVRAGLLKLAEERETVNRIQVCYNALPVEEYKILSGLYEKRLLYKEVEENSGMNHRQFEKVRKRGLERIRELYESNLTNIEIIQLKQMEYTQLNLF